MAFTILSSFLSVVAGQLRRLPVAGLPGDLFGLVFASRIRTDRNWTAKASTDFGQMVKAAPEAVFHPATPADIAALIRFSASSVAGKKYRPVESEIFEISRLSLGSKFFLYCSKFSYF
jgi:cytokinin dehydrogenase